MHPGTAQPCPRRGHEADPARGDPEGLGQGGRTRRRQPRHPALSRSSRQAAAIALAAGAAVAHGGPASAVLGTFLARPPARLLGCHLTAGARPGVALTFDDGPSPDSTPATLDLLDELGLRATFFLLGAAVRAEPDLALEIGRRGHEVGSHGMLHAHHLLRSPRWVRADAAAAVADLARLGLRPRFYRPPYGQVSGGTLAAARDVGCEVALWSGWGREFAEHRPGPVLDRLTGALRPGAILLLHDSDACCPPGTTAIVRAALPGLAKALAERGLEAAPLGELVG